jgi:hypothetical protein
MSPDEFAARMRAAARDVPDNLRKVNERFAEEAATKARANVYGRVPGARGVRRRRSGPGSLSRTRASISASPTDTGGRIGIGGPSAPGALGHEFGGGGRPRTRQFPPHKGKEGYFLFPTIRSLFRDDSPWQRIVDDAIGSE